MASSLCVIGLIICVHRKIESHGQGLSTFTPQLGNVVAKGLDKPSIETLWDLQLPKARDNICPICLLEYQAEDILRVIPSCMHYFHVDCIDEWLKQNATFPSCRN